jgi:hypothetical protein
MSVVGARFGDLEAAIGALAELRARLGVLPGAAGVRPLGSTRYEHPAREFVLAGRFEPGQEVAVKEILARHGGVVLAGSAGGAAVLDEPGSDQYVTASKDS